MTDRDLLVDLGIFAAMIVPATVVYVAGYGLVILGALRALEAVQEHRGRRYPCTP